MRPTPSAPTLSRPSSPDQSGAPPAAGVMVARTGALASAAGDAPALDTATAPVAAGASVTSMRAPAVSVNASTRNGGTRTARAAADAGASSSVCAWSATGAAASSRASGARGAAERWDRVMSAPADADAVGDGLPRQRAERDDDAASVRRGGGDGQVGGRRDVAARGEVQPRGDGRTVDRHGV